MIGVTTFLRWTAPDFMWCSVGDLFLMYEQINEDIDWFTFKEVFHQTFRKGEFLSKPDPNMSRSRRGKTGRMLYIRNDGAALNCNEATGGK